MRIEVPHQLSRTEAKSRVERTVQQLRAEYGDLVSAFESRWERDTLHFQAKARGMTAGGRIDILDDQIVVEGKLPLMARPFEKRIRERISDEVTRRLDLA